jgi:hypothetical protein
VSLSFCGKLDSLFAELAVKVDPLTLCRRLSDRYKPPPSPVAALEVKLELVTASVPILQQHLAELAMHWNAAQHSCKDQGRMQWQSTSRPTLGQTQRQHCPERCHL